MQKEVYRIELEDGRSVNVNASSRANAEARAREWAQENPAENSSENMGRTYADLVGQAQELPHRMGAPGRRLAGAPFRAFNVEDELVGLGAEYLTPGREADGSAAAERARENIDRYREEYPLTSMAEEMITTSMIPARGPMVLGSAIGGAFSGAMSGDDLQSRTEGAVVGAGLGAGAALGLKGLGSSLGRVVEGVASSPVGRAVARRMDSAQRRRATGQSTPDSRAIDAFAEAFETDGMSPQQVTEALNAIARDDQAALMDIARPGGAFEKLLRDASQQDTRAGMTIASRNEELQLEGTRRVQSLIQQHIGTGRVRATLDEIREAAADRANPLYDEFYRRPSLPVTQISAELRASPTFNRAVQQAVSNALDAGDQASASALTRALRRRQSGDQEVLELNPNSELPPQVIQLIKTELDDQIQRALSGSDPDRAAARRLQDVRRRFLGIVDEAYPVYARARQVYAGEAANETALRTGENLFRGSVEDLQREVDAMSPSQLEAFRIGASRAMDARIEDLRNANPNTAENLLTPSAQERIRLVLGSDADAGNFFSTLRRESQRRRRAAASGRVRSGEGEQQQMPSDIVEDSTYEAANLQAGSVLRRVVQGVGQAISFNSRTERNRAIAAIATDVARARPEGREIIYRMVERQHGQAASATLRRYVDRLGVSVAAQAAQQDTDQVQRSRQQRRLQELSQPSRLSGL